MAAIISRCKEKEWLPYYRASEELLMDARTVAQAAKVEVGTLNSWVHRGLVPGMTIGARGRQRHFDLNTAVNIGLIVALGHVGISALTAAVIAGLVRLQHKRLLVIFGISLAPGVIVYLDPNR